MSETRHTPGTWRKGRSGGSIVTDCPTPDDCAQCTVASTAFYGGHVIAESVMDSERPLLIAAPALLEALEMCRSALDMLMGDTDLPEDDSYEMKACQAASAAIGKARP